MESIWEMNKRTIGAFIEGNIKTYVEDELVAGLHPDFLRFFIKEAKKEHDDLANRLEWLVDSMNVDYDDLFREYDENDL